jgi:hypothetical protein
MRAFSSTLTVNSLFWFTSLELNEQGVTRRVQEDLMPYLGSIGLHWQICEPQTAAQLLGALNQITQMARAGLKPVLHFDMHGDMANGIKLATAGEFVSWPDLVVSLRAINVATGNNLCVVSGACFSMNAVWQFTLSDACPFFILIAPENEVTAGFIEDNTLDFYKSLFEGLEVVEAHARHLAPKFAIFHCERMLTYLLRKYVQEYCVGRRGDERREQLLTKAVAANLVHNRLDRRRIRREAKAWTRPGQAMVDRFVRDHASTFLMDKPLRFDAAEVTRFLKGE